MQGGVGRYCKNLVNSLRNEDLEVLVVCNELGEGDFSGISPYNTNNSEVLLRLVKEVEPDLVHVQYEQGLYGLHLDPIDPRRTTTNIEFFYNHCRVPIVSTLHSVYTFGQWMRLIVPLENRTFGRIGTLLGMAYDYWTHLLNYESFTSLVKQKIGPNLDIVYQITISHLFGSENKKSKWKMEYEDTIYKIYDWDRNLAGYFFPKYDLVETPNSGDIDGEEEEEEEELIEKLNKSHEKVRGGNILFPMIKLNLLDKEEGIDLDYTIDALELNLQRSRAWKQWLQQNHRKFAIIGNAVCTSREDRNMLSIVLGVDSNIILGEKETLIALTPLLDELHGVGLL